MARYSNDSIEIHTTAESGGAVAIGGITTFSESLNSDISTPDTATPYDRFQSIMMQRPEVGFSTEAIATVLDNVGFTGKCIVSDGTHPGVMFYQRKHDPCGPQGRASGSNHKKITFAEGHLFIDSLNVPSGGNATIALTAHGVSAADPPVQPYVIAYNAAVPTSPVINEQFTLSRLIQVGGISITQITNLSVAWNVNFEKPQYAGSIWPTLVDIQKIKALITISTDDMSLLNDSGKITRLGKACTHANSFFKIQRREANAGLYSESAEQHIVGTFAGLAVITRQQASGGSAGNLEIQIATLDDGTNNPIVFTTGQALD